jgi:hypothetical protein
MTMELNKQILKIISDELGVDLSRRTRKRDYVEGRFIYFDFCRNHLNFSLEKAGKTLGYDHATVMHSVKQCKNLCEVDPSFKRKYDLLLLKVDEKIGLLANPYDKYLGKEDVLQRGVIAYMKAQYPQAFVVHIPNEGRRSMFERYKFKTLGGVSGMPDIMVFNPNNKRNGLAIELKAGTNKPTKNQLDCLKRLQELDWEAFWSADFEYIKQRIDQYFNNN